MRPVTVDEALETIGTGPFQYRLLGIFGLVWAADAMQVLAIGFAAPSLAASFGLTIPQAIQAGTAFFLGMLVGAWGFGRLADRIGRRKVLIATVLIDAVFGLASVFAHDFALLLALRLLTGIGVGGTLPVDYAMMAEFLPPQTPRPLAGGAGGVLGHRHRRRGAGRLGGQPMGGRSGLALAVRRDRAAGTRRLLASPLAAGIAALPAASRRGARRRARSWTASPASTGRAPTTAPLGSPPAHVHGCAICLAGACGSARPDPGRLAAGSTAYYGVFIWLPGRLVTQGYGFVRGYGFLVLLALAQIPGYALAAIGVETIGRRRTLIRFLAPAPPAACCSPWPSSRPGSPPPCWR